MPLIDSLSPNFLNNPRGCGNDSDIVRVCTVDVACKLPITLEEESAAPDTTLRVLCGILLLKSTDCIGEGFIAYGVMEFEAAAAPDKVFRYRYGVYMVLKSFTDLEREF